MEKPSFLPFLLSKQACLWKLFDNGIVKDDIVYFFLLLCPFLLLFGVSCSSFHGLRVLSFALGCLHVFPQQNLFSQTITEEERLAAVAAARQELEANYLAEAGEFDDSNGDWLLLKGICVHMHTCTRSCVDWPNTIYFFLLVLWHNSQSESAPRKWSESVHNWKR